MIYPWFDYYQRQALDMMKQFQTPAAAGPWQRYLELGPKIIEKNAASNEPVSIELREALETSHVDHRLIESNPFGAIHQYRRKDAPERTLFTVLPHSGYAASALRGFIDGLLTLGTVMVTEWRDPRLIPQKLGQFGVLDQVGLIERGLTRAGRDVTMIGLSQSGWPALLAAERQPDLVNGLAVLGAPIDPGMHATALQECLKAMPMSMIEHLMTSTVADRYPGAGRRVFPALLQLWTHAGTSPFEYLDAQNGLITGLLGEKPTERHDEMHRLCDVPAELFIDMLALLRDQPDATVARFARRFNRSTLAQKPLLTVEAGADPLVGAMQTHRTGEWLQSRNHQMVDIRGGVHTDLFAGPEFSAHVLPGISNLISSIDDSAA